MSNYHPKIQQQPKSKNPNLQNTLTKIQSLDINTTQPTTILDDISILEQYLQLLVPPKHIISKFLKNPNLRYSHLIISIIHKIATIQSQTYLPQSQPQTESTTPPPTQPQPSIFTLSPDEQHPDKFKSSTFEIHSQFLHKVIHFITQYYTQYANSVTLMTATATSTATATATTGDDKSLTILNYDINQFLQYKTNQRILDFIITREIPEDLKINPASDQQQQRPQDPQNPHPQNQQEQERRILLEKNVKKLVILGENFLRIVLRLFLRIRIYESSMLLLHDDALQITMKSTTQPVQLSPQIQEERQFIRTTSNENDTQPMEKTMEKTKDSLLTMNTPPPAIFNQTNITKKATTPKPHHPRNADDIDNLSSKIECIQQQLDDIYRVTTLEKLKKKDLFDEEQKSSNIVQTFDNISVIERHIDEIMTKSQYASSLNLRKKLLTLKKESFLNVSDEDTKDNHDGQVQDNQDTRDNRDNRDNRGAHDDDNQDNLNVKRPHDSTTTTTTTNIPPQFVSVQYPLVQDTCSATDEYMKLFSSLNIPIQSVLHAEHVEHAETASHTTSSPQTIQDHTTISYSLSDEDAQNYTLFHTYLKDLLQNTYLKQPTNTTTTTTSTSSTDQSKIEEIILKSFGITLPLTETRSDEQASSASQQSSTNMITDSFATVSDISAPPLLTQLFDTSSNIITIIQSMHLISKLLSQKSKHTKNEIQKSISLYHQYRDDFNTLLQTQNELLYPSLLQYVYLEFYLFCTKATSQKYRNDISFITEEIDDLLATIL